MAKRDEKVTEGYLSRLPLRTAHSKRGQRGPSILAAARGLFFRRGYDGTTMEQVARAAGLSKRSVYLYFKNKDELFLAVGAEGLDVLRGQLEAIPVDELSVEEGVSAILDVYLRFAREHADYFRIIFKEANQEMVRESSSPMRKRVAESERACLSVAARVGEKAIAGGFVPPVDPWEMAGIFWGTVTGIVLLAMGGSQTVFTRKTREELSEKAVWLLLSGLRAQAQEPARPAAQSKRRGKR